MKSMFIILISLMIFPAIGFCGANTLATPHEVWTCRVGNSPSFKVNIKDGKGVGHFEQGETMSLTSENSEVQETVSTLSASNEGGHDITNYQAQLIRVYPNDFLPQAEVPQTKGQVVLKSWGFIDCLGDYDQTDVYDCDVQLNWQ